MPKLLLIEDDDELRSEISSYMTFSGYDVSTAVNGVDGIEKAHEIKPDVIVCDVMMPEVDGYGVLQELRSSAETSAIPFILLTATVEKQDVQRGMELGANEYLKKPFSFNELRSVIESYVK